MVGAGNGALAVINDTSISYLVHRVLDSLVHVCMLLGGGDELEKIKSSLNTIQSVIESAEERPLKDQALGDWLEMLKDAAYSTEDVLDEYATEGLRRQVEALNSYPVRNPVTNKVRKIASSFSIYLNSAKMTFKLKEIRKRLESIEEERRKFQVSERVQIWEREFKEHRQTGSLVDESQVYGRDEDKRKIMNLLLRPIEGHEDENVSVIPIVGMGGLGKTTLARLVFNDDEVRKHFELKMWVCVFDDFDVKRLMEKIVHLATGSYVSELDDLKVCIMEALIGRRFLLVLDDVWNEEHDKWNRLRALLICGGRGSRIVVTTRSLKIASIMSRIEPHHLEGLREGDCWRLFASWAFPDHRERDHPQPVQIGKDIVRKCKGVPLAVITLGSLLSDKRNESEWVFFRDTEFSNLAAEDVRGILPALRLSYYHLNPHLRHCFAFCAIFPKDYCMDKEFLIQFWMAHSCVPSRRGMELEDIGIEILNELLNRSLFQEVKDENDGSLKIKVHDLVHDLAQSVMRNDCCIIERDKSINISKRVRHLSFHLIDSSISPTYYLYEAQSLRTLLVLDSDFKVPQNMAISKCLRVLHLECSSLTPLLTSLDELIHLRYFRLTCASIETLPESISSLQNLQTLKLNGCVGLRELPKGTRNLINLRCLDIDRCDSLSHMPAKIGMLSCLRKLPLFVMGDGASVCSGIEELQCLINLRGNLNIDHLERVAIPSNAKRANLVGKPNLDRLQLCWRIPDDEKTLKIEVEEEVLEGLQPHENLKELEIIGYGGIHFPSWMMGFLLPSIVKITLKNCRRCELLPPLGKLPLLKFLHIECMDCVENIGIEFYGNEMSEGFPSLETLEIADMSSLKVWSGLHGKRVFRSLQILRIRDCIDLKSLPEGIGNLSSLTVVELGEVGLTSLPKSMQELSTLRDLRIYSCPQLPSLPEWVGNLVALQFLTIHGCPQMVSLPKGLQHLTGLKILYIIQCPELQRRCEETGEDFHKIRHIPEVKFWW